MRLTTKMRYGTRAMLDLALHHNGGPTSLKDIAERQNVSLKYLERLFATLQASGLVRGIRGAHGGYLLSEPPEKVTLRQLYETLEGSNPLVDCTSDPQVCDRSERCVTLGGWAQLYDVCMETVESITLDDLVHRTEQLEGQPGMYYI
ncbi:MAG: Rrf2 family transcriptional regulator [Anaerolineae bacterium]|nr:Rrf2 family transcriptional regulator [Anaerolineae bacterium]